MTELTHEELAEYAGRPYADLPRDTACPQHWPVVRRCDDGMLLIDGVSDSDDDMVVVDIDSNGTVSIPPCACDAMMSRDDARGELGGPLPDDEDDDNEVE